VKPGELPKRRDKAPEWRDAATYARDEVELLISARAIPQARRVQYALKAIAGLRHGEVAALRWRHLDRSAEPPCSAHHRLVVLLQDAHDQADEDRGDARRAGAPDACARAREVATLVARHLWPAARSRRRLVPTLNMTCVKAAEAGHAFKRDLARLGLSILAGERRSRGGHDLRGWYLTQAIEDGADAALLRRTTHAAPKDVTGGYERYGWPAICREVAKLRVSLPDEEPGELATSDRTVAITNRERWVKSATPTGTGADWNARSWSSSC
jgi:integrase